MLHSPTHRERALVTGDAPQNHSGFERAPLLAASPSAMRVVHLDTQPDVLLFDLTPVDDVYHVTIGTLGDAVQ